MKKTTYSLDDLLKIRADGAKEFSSKCEAEKKKRMAEAIAGRSGVSELHQRCTVDNYLVASNEQAKVRDFTRWFIDSFDNNNGTSFVFSGESGTGKNHLAAAICNELMRQGKSCLVITITELMIRLRKCYGKDSETGEDDFIKSLVKLDLLVLDEIGLQRGTDAEHLLINQLIDQRLNHLRPTGVLTNLNYTDFDKLVGVRVSRRLKANRGKWLKFNWEAYQGEYI